MFGWRRVIGSIGTVLAFGCSRDGGDAAGTAASPLVSGLPQSLRIEQRTTTTVPGSGGALELTIDDITRGQVMVTLLRNSGEALIGPVSMRTGDRRTFTVEKSTLCLRLDTFELSLVGIDYANFVIEDPPKEASLRSEVEKIEHLIETVANLDDAVFLRNGAEHSAVEAAEHLRRKFAAASDEVLTADQFVAGVASRSSLTGEEYRIRFSDGRTITVQEFYSDLLAPR